MDARHRRIAAAFPVAGAVLFAIACQHGPSAESAAIGTPVYRYEIVRTFPHSPEAFTQGLVFADGALYESTGQYGSSSLRKVDIETGEVVQMLGLDSDLFGEGLTLFNDQLIQLTWQAGTGFVYDRATFELQREFQYATEGWGLTHDGQRLIMSDGTSTLYFLDPETLSEIDRIQVHNRGRPLAQLNELEYIDGEIYANVWRTDQIARIAPDTGQVVAWIDLSGLLSAADLKQSVDVLNGIAYDPEDKRLFVTGKLWPKLFEIKLVAQ